MISVVRHVYFVPSYLATLLPIKEPVVYHTDASNLNICQTTQINNYCAKFIFGKVIKREYFRPSAKVGNFSGRLSVKNLSSF
jgi:hypothetical protein